MRTIATHVPTMDKAKIIFSKKRIFGIKTMKINQSKPLTSQESCIIHQYDQGIQEKIKELYLPDPEDLLKPPLFHPSPD